MTARGIDRINPDSIQNLDDMRIWAREQEGRTEQRFDQVEAAVDSNKSAVTLNRWWLTTVTVGFGVTIFIIAAISGVVEIMKAFF